MTDFETTLIILGWIGLGSFLGGFLLTYCAVRWGGYGK